MPLEFISGNLLEAETEFIVQQCCCTAIKSHGLSADIASKWSDVNPYKSRRQYFRNWAIEDDRPIPGSIEIYEFETHDSYKYWPKGVICAFAQYNHGKSGKYIDPLKLDKKYGDSPDNRIQYFKDCLDLIASQKIKSIGFPYKIGCGLAGGCWEKYLSIIKKWSNDNPEIKVYIYKLSV